MVEGDAVSRPLPVLVPALVSFSFIVLFQTWSLRLASSFAARTLSLPLVVPPLPSSLSLPRSAVISSLSSRFVAAAFP